jgi:hypothetical protein
VAAALRRAASAGGFAAGEMTARAGNARVRRSSRLQLCGLPHRHERGRLVRPSEGCELDDVQRSAHGAPSLLLHRHCDHVRVEDGRCRIWCRAVAGHPARAVPPRASRTVLFGDPSQLRRARRRRRWAGLVPGNCALIDRWLTESGMPTADWQGAGAGPAHGSERKQTWSCLTVGSDKLCGRT